MFKKFAHLGINIVVLLISVSVFAFSLFALLAIGKAQKPEQVTVLAAAHDMSIGDVIGASDIIEKSMYADDSTGLYFTAADVGGVIGGVVTLPHSADQPLLKSAILAPASADTRLSSTLTLYPEGSLFPFPLDAQNVIAPDLASVHPGDLVGITVVITDRPQEPEENTLAANTYGVAPTATPSPEEIAQQEFLAQTQPPLAKDIFPDGALVIAVQGLPSVQAATTGDDLAAYTSPSMSYPSETRQMLILLVPNQSREVLALALAQSQQIVVSLLARGDTAPSAGFTYWDLEDWFRRDREELIPQQ
jgi:hypothetical protein